MTRQEPLLPGPRTAAGRALLAKAVAWPLPIVESEILAIEAEAAAGTAPTLLAARIDEALDKYLPGSHPDLAQAIAEHLAAAGWAVTAKDAESPPLRGVLGSVLYDALQVASEPRARMQRFEEGRNGADDSFYIAATDRTVLIMQLERALDQVKRQARLPAAPPPTANADTGSAGAATLDTEQLARALHQGGNGTCMNWEPGYRLPTEASEEMDAHRREAEAVAAEYARLAGEDSDSRAVADAGEGSEKPARRVELRADLGVE